MTNESIHLDPTMPFAVREKLAAEESAQDANRQKRSRAVGDDESSGQAQLVLDKLDKACS